MPKKFIPFIVLWIFLVSCSPELVPVPQPSPVPTEVTPMSTSPGSNPLMPLPGEKNLSRGNVFIDNAEIVMLESNPPQFGIHVTGNLPTPCHHLRALVSPPDDKNQIQVEVYSLYDTKQACTAVLQPFDTSIPLGSLPAGHYTVFVNGEKIGELVAP